MSLEVKATIRTAGDVGVLSREEKERRGMVPQPIPIRGGLPLRWAECRLIAEAGGCDSSLGWAVSAAEAAAAAGFWGFKVQMLRRDRLTTGTALTYGQHGPRGLQWDVFADHGLNPGEWAVLKGRCDELGLVMFASCWDEDSVDRAMSLDLPLLKVGSGDITYEQLLGYVGKCGVPVILSTGASYDWEIDRALEWLDTEQVCLAACTLSYPCEAQDANLNRIGTMRQQWPHLLVGYSDHCAEPWMVGEAKRAGATFVEAHWTVTPGGGGDHDFALHPGNAALMMARPDGWNGDHHGDGQLAPMPCEIPAREGARRSIAVTVHVTAGERFRLRDFDYLRPGTGIPPAWASELVGRRALRDYEPGELVDPEQL